ncbi:hypothetical protein QWI17_09160 [Gilvimarinus sp. SDUM040013]|uniref:hypothetical protein n=1 Tax=Gilvimarinus gilvus TaxID=3058038 RepID=UPI0026710DDD|nr:hypothetical protein [Gilvimarinus sp. SDUM040013]MDO3386003.1 hypothetical protein [Gilvimarinus sp. SDUM040013]
MPVLPACLAWMTFAVTGRGVSIGFVKVRLAFTGNDSPVVMQLLSTMGVFAEFERV